MQSKNSSVTEMNLLKAFAGESQANRKYLAFAKQAEKEGYPRAAKLFRAAAEAETVHAHAHLDVLGGVKSTPENLQSAMKGEAYEFKEMYPTFLAEAEKEGNKGAVMSFRNALAVEEIHHRLYSDAFKAAGEGKDLPATAIFVCSLCGNTVLGQAPEKCPICGNPRSKFSEVK